MTWIVALLCLGFFALGWLAGVLDGKRQKLWFIICAVAFTYLLAEVL